MTHPQSSNAVRFIAHDLKTPLTVIRLQAELALRNFESGANAVGAERNLRTILRTVEWMSDLVEDLLEGDAQAELDDVPVSEYVLDAMDRVRALANARGVRFHVSLPPSLPNVRVNRSRAMQILLNLLVNALDHGPQRSWIHVSAVLTGGYVTFSVRDEGSGVSPEIAANIFRPGFRGPSSSGHGLGLAIASRRVSEFGGEIWCERGEPVGAQFRFTLPTSTRSIAAHPAVHDMHA
ncbi:MAG: sensor histidine kinase [Myxococcaceae bacterium]